MHEALCKKFDSLPIDKLTFDNIENLYQIYYFLRIASSQNQQHSYLENNGGAISEEGNKDFFKTKIYINYLIKNSTISKNKFGPFSWMKGDIELTGDDIGKMKIEAQKRMKIGSTNILFEDNTIFLVLKARRIKFNDVFYGNQYYFNFYVGEKLITSPVKVKFYTMSSSEKLANFDDIMEKIKINQELIIAFALYPICHFHDPFLRYHNYKIREYVFYLDSSYSNPLVSKYSMKLVIINFFIFIQNF